jgi:poly-gamma-glutamate capsule biosynthesis protein CapA/YwtB (metallophosphatase superfamily)
MGTREGHGPAARRGGRFVAVGVAASLASLAVQQGALAVTQAPVVVTALRLGALLPLVYLGYSRYVLADVLAGERARVGAATTELRMLARVASSLGASIAAKLLLEPIVTGLLLRAHGPRAAGLSVLLADFTYGPLVNYVVLLATTRHAAPPPATPLAPRVSALRAAALPAAWTLLLRGAFALLGALRLWRRPRRTTGDFPTMSLADKVHWLYKADRPLLAGEVTLERRSRVAREVAGAVVRLKLNAVGDLLPCARLAGDGRGPLDPIASVLFAADVTFANLECPIVDGPEPRIVLCPSAAPTLALSPVDFDSLCSRGAFDVVATANNHAMDAGLAGVESTLAALEHRGLLAVGTSRTPEEAARPRILRRGGVAFGFVAATFGLNGHERPEGALHGVDVEPLNALHGELATPGLERRVRACREAGAQIVIASLHWGHEFEFAPRKRQRDLARRLVDVGVDVVIGHHPHVIQPLELVPSSVEAGRAGVVLYSLGSLTKPLNSAAQAVAAIASIGVAVDARGRAVVESAELVPVVQVVELEGGHPRASVERLSSLGASTDRARAAFLSAARTSADHVLGPDWRRGDGPGSGGRGGMPPANRLTMMCPSRRDGRPADRSVNPPGSTPGRCPR